MGVYHKYKRGRRVDSHIPAYWKFFSESSQGDDFDYVIDEMTGNIEQLLRPEYSGIKPYGGKFTPAIGDEWPVRKFQHMTYYSGLAFWCPDGYTVHSDLTHKLWVDYPEIFEWRYVIVYHIGNEYMQSIMNFVSFIPFAGPVINGIIAEGKKRNWLAINLFENVAFGEHSAVNPPIESFDALEWWKKLPVEKEPEKWGDLPDSPLDPELLDKYRPPIVSFFDGVCPRLILFLFIIMFVGGLFK